MSINWDIYNKRLNTNGSTERDRQLERLKTNIEHHAPHSLSYKSILLNGEPCNLIINTGTQPYYKEFETLPGQSINIGDYVDFANKKWLVTTADADDEVYIDGRLEECNWLLKWQNETGEIIERWAVIMSASKYNDGTSGNNVIVLGSDQLSIKIPVDEESLKLKKSMSKKFFIDNDSTNPTAYELTGTGNVPDTYGGHGVTSWIVKECAYSPTADDLKYGVCNYITPTTPSQPTNPDETVDLFAHITYAGSDNIRIGGNGKTFTASLTDANGTEDTMTAIWTITPNNYVTTSQDGNSILVKCEDEDLDGETITISVTDEHSGFYTSVEITLSVF